MKTTARMLAIWATAVALVLGDTACSSSDSGDSRSAAPTTAAATTAHGPAPITIVVTNDDGIGASGIDELARQLGELDAVTVKVVAPATNQSGKGRHHHRRRGRL